MCTNDVYFHYKSKFHTTEFYKSNDGEQMKSCFVKLGAEGKKIFFYKDKQLKYKFKQVLWGDQLRVVEENANGLLKVNWAPNSKDKKCTVYIQKEDTTSHRPLEIIFVDVGQGDGCVVIAPGKKGKERIVVIDAGPGSHMWESWTIALDSLICFGQVF